MKTHRHPTDPLSRLWRATVWYGAVTGVVVFYLILFGLALDLVWRFFTQP